MRGVVSKIEDVCIWSTWNAVFINVHDSYIVLLSSLQVLVYTQTIMDKQSDHYALDHTAVDPLEVEKWTIVQLSEWIGRHGGEKTGKKDALVNRVRKIIKDGPQ